jgi:SAM-dependent methyltransferase
MFDPDVHSYSADYEETQGFSPTFRNFHEQLASRLVSEYDLHGKTVLEIGCGKGEFLALLCRIGGNRGIGIDPAFVSDRNPAEGCDVTYIADFYSEKYADYEADFICCKMTLEHIYDVFEFVSTVRRAMRKTPKALVFFQVPDVRRILKECAFWDVYYEHCSYFGAGSLARLFERAGFEVISTRLEFGQQYLTVLAKPRPDDVTPQRRAEGDLHQVHVQRFKRSAERIIGSWRARIRQMARSGQQIVIWGSGSKGVAFLAALGISDEIKYVVDINPYRQGKFMVGTGHEIVSPEFLTRAKPDVAIAMNPIYQYEILRELGRLGLSTRLLSV